MAENDTHSQSKDPDLIKRRGTWAAALVHVFTGLGAVFAFLATLAVFARAWEEVFFWLTVALIVDGVDGPLARAFDVGKRLKRFSGERLDLVVDYLTYVFVPVLALHFAGYLPGTLGLLVCCAVLLSSLFHFADVDSKAETNHFIGFPAVWNIVAFYIFALDLSVWWAGSVVIFFIILTFVPLRFVHPVRVTSWQHGTLAATVLGVVALCITLWGGLPASLLVQVVLVGVAVYFAVLAAGEGLVDDEV